MGLTLTDLPFRITLWISDASLKATAKTCLISGKDAGGLPGYVGLFPIGHCAVGRAWEGVDQSVVVFTFVKKEFPWGTKGLFYSEHPLPEGNKNDWHAPHHIYGPWYSWEYTGW